MGSSSSTELPLLRAEQTRGALPAETDVLIVGGGLAGTALAYDLAGEGIEVVLLERSELNREASGTNAGSFRRTGVRRIRAHFPQ